ncbi:MAG: PD40 domain-containing protein [Candidatus Aminicenantes bacterium]|nr:PD40 domain-containing protein [Candidatus Aminicenantes bacterium]
MGAAVNSEFSETCPALSHDGKYIFFSRYNEANEVSDIYWVDAKILGELKTKN